MRRSLLRLLVVGGLVLGGALFLQPAVLGADAPGGAPAGRVRSPRDFFLRNPLAYAEIREAGILEAKLSALKIWGDQDAAAKGIARLGDLAARQLALQSGGDAKAIRLALAQVRAVRVAVYPPISWPPEPLVALEVADPAAFLKLLGGPGGAKKLAPHGDVELWSVPVSLNGQRKTTVAAVAGTTVLLSPFEPRVRQALDVAAGGQGGLEGSPGFAECAKRFGERPVWAYVNADALCAVGMLEDHDTAMAQPILTALSLPSFRWAGLGSSLGDGPVPFEAHVEYFPWNSFGDVLGRVRAADGCVAAAVPADAAFFVSAGLGDPGEAWKALKARLLAIGPLDEDMDEDEGRDEIAQGLEEMNQEFKQSMGFELEKDLLPLLSGDLGCFVSGGKRPSFGMVLVGRDEESARKLMALFKVKDGTIGPVGGEDGGDLLAARIGRVVILGEEEDLLKGAVAAAAAGKTMASSAACKTQMEALGAERGATFFVPVAELRKLADGEDWGKLLSEDGHAAASLAVTRTGATLRCTGPMEAVFLAPMLGELDRMAAEQERDACGQRMEAVAKAAREFAGKNGGRLPASFDDLGPAFKAGASARACPTSGKEYALVPVGLLPERAVEAGRNFLWCYEAGTPHEGMSWAVVVYGRGGASVNMQRLQPGELEKRLARDRAILALADPARAPLSDEERKAIDAAAADLGAADFDKREAASKKLIELGPKCMAAVAALLDHKDLEVASRAEHVLKELTGIGDLPTIRKLAGLPPGPDGAEAGPRKPPAVRAPRAMPPAPAAPVERF